MIFFFLLLLYILCDFIIISNLYVFTFVLKAAASIRLSLFAFAWGDLGYIGDLGSTSSKITQKQKLLQPHRTELLNILVTSTPLIPSQQQCDKLHTHPTSSSSTSLQSSSSYMKSPSRSAKPSMFVGRLSGWEHVRFDLDRKVTLMCISLSVVYRLFFSFL